MKIGKDKVVSIHYTLRDDEGNILDTSSGKQPLDYLHGHGNLIPGMEEGVEGKEKGDKLQIKVSPEKGYGLRDEQHVQQVPLAAFGTQAVHPGMQFQAGGDHGQYVVTVTEVGLDTVTVDANHPLAGKQLTFDVEVMDVREASEDELAHGHVHGPGGHHH
jgi:FKBP-type peptidyl-prolyl cis-trans isomerase SlyD